MNDDEPTTGPAAPPGPQHVVLGLTEAAARLVGGVLDSGGPDDTDRLEPPSPGDEGPAGLSPAGGPDLADLAVGLAFTAGDVAARAAGLGWRTASGLLTAARGVASLPGVDLVARPLGTATASVVERGRLERRRADEASNRALGATVAKATGELLPAGLDHLVADGTVPALLDQVLPVALEGVAGDPEPLLGLVQAVLPGILEAALPDVLGRLADDPDALLPLVAAVVDKVLPDILGQLAQDPDALLGVVDPVLPGVIDRLGADPEVLLTLIRAILPALLDEVLPVALDRLNDDPSAVRDLVLGQSGGLATEAANTVRSRAVAGDELVDRITRRVLRRPARPMLTTATDAGGSPATPALEAPTADALPPAGTTPRESDR